MHSQPALKYVHKADLCSLVNGEAVMHLLLFVCLKRIGCLRSAADMHHTCYLT